MKTIMEKKTQIEQILERREKLKKNRNKKRIKNINQNSSIFFFA
jgi:hypothetical protein